MDKIEILRTFFRISNAAFEFANTVQLVVNGNEIRSKMYNLHKIALSEIEKENPDILLIDILLAEMEKTAEFNNHNSKSVINDEPTKPSKT